MGHRYNTIPIPSEWASLVNPLYKKGDWAQPGNWRPIVCATMKAKLVLTLILGRIAPFVFAQVPASMWEAMAARSSHEAIFLQDTALGMNPYEMIVSSLDVDGRVPSCPASAPHRDMGCHGPLILTLDDRIHPDPALRCHLSRRPYPLDRHRQQGSPRVATRAPSSTSSSPSCWHLSWEGYTGDTPHTRYAPLTSTPRTTTS